MNDNINILMDKYDILEHTFDDKLAKPNPTLLI